MRCGNINHEWADGGTSWFRPLPRVQPRPSRPGRCPELLRGDVAERGPFPCVQLPLLNTDVATSLNTLGDTPLGVGRC